MERLTKTRSKILLELLDVMPDGALAAVYIGEAAAISSGSLYPSLRALVDAGLLDARWVIEDDNPSKMYSLTPNGVLLARAIEGEAVVATSWRAFLPGAT